MTNLQSRLAGFALILGGALALVGYLAAGTIAGGSGDAHFIDPLFQPLYAIALAGTILTVIGLPAVLAAQRGHFPRLTTVGYAGTLAALLILSIGVGVVEGFVKPYLVTHGGIPKDPSGIAAWEIVGLVCMVVGLVCLGVAVLRAGTLPRWVGGFMILTPFLSFALGSMRPPFDSIADDFMNIALIAIGWQVAVRDRRSLAAAPVTEREPSALAI